MLSCTPKISADKLRAFITLSPVSGETLNLTEILGEISNAGVKAEIDTAAIQDAIDRKRWGESILIAQGKTATKGANGSIKYHFETHPKVAPQIKEDGSVDFRNLNITQSVKAGQELARLLPPAIGEDGIDVCGNPIPALTGKPAKLNKGKNVSFADTDNTVIKADIDGNVKLSRTGAVEVDAAFTVNKDVDFTTGNIDVMGDLVIQGDVKAGFKIKASGEIEINGTIEDSEVEAGGSILVKRGFLGDSKGIIKSEKDVILKFVHGQRVTAGGDIHLHEESIQSELTAGGSILAQEGKGIIIGGVNKAGKTLIARVIGNQHYTKTEISAADKSGLQERIAQITKDLGGLNAKLNQITEKMTWIMTKGAKTKLSPAEEVEFRTLDKLSADITVTQESLVKEQKELEAKLHELRSIGLIKVIKMIYPGTTIRIAGLVFELNDERGPGEFRVRDGQIAFTSL